MNNTIQRTVKCLLFVLMLLACAIYFINIAAAEILTANSNTTITNISYSIDISKLNLTENYYYEYSGANNESNQSENYLTQIINITSAFEILYECILTINNDSFIYTSTTSSVNHSETITEIINNVTNVNLFAELYCDYNVSINDSITNTTIYALFNNETNTTDNITNVSNYTDVRYYLTSAYVSKEIISDNISPEINVSIPEYLNTTEDIVLVDMILNIYDLTNVNCSIYIIDSYSIDSYSNYSMYLFFNASMNNTITSSFNLTEGNHTYTIKCIDELSNPQARSGNIFIEKIFIEEPVFFDISLNKDAFNLGETGEYTVNANNGSNVSITICPIAEGWVQCYITPEYVNQNFPLSQLMPYSNKTGKYLIDGIMRYNNQTLKKNLTFDVINTLTAEIEKSSNNAAVGDVVTFNATASGGIGNYYYKWTMHDNTIFYGTGAYKTYSSPGEYSVILYVNDSHNNNYTDSTTVKIKSKYSLKIVTIDKRTGSRMPGVYIDMDRYNGTTNSNGEITFTLPEAKYDIYASKNEYGALIDNFNLDDNLTLYMNMTFEDDSAPEITLLTSDDSVFSKESVKLKFKADDNTKLYCELYVAEMNSSWYSLKDYGGELLTNTEYTFELTNTSNGAYNWKITCSDDDKNTATSKERSFIVSDDSVKNQLESIGTDYDYINSALDKIYAVSGQEAEVVEILGIKKSLKELLEKNNNLDRDLHNLVFRKDLDEEGKKKAEQELIRSIDDLKRETPINLEVTDSKTFVKYVRDDALKKLIEEYVTMKNININQKLLFENIKKTQGKAIISTKARNVILYYSDGREREITIITKEINIPDSVDEAAFKTNSVSFIEVIPKTIVVSVKELNIINKDFTVLRDDPIIEFPSDTKTISYYINKSISLDLLQDIDSIIIDKNIQIESPTGFAVFGIDSVKDISLDGKTLLIIIIVLLILTYLFINFDIWHKIRSLFSNSKKKISYVRVLINDSLDQLDVDEYDKAALIYREIKLSYEASDPVVQKQVYDDCYDLCNKLDIYYFNQLYEEVENKIKIESKDTILVYDKFLMVYNKIDDKYKNELNDKLKAIRGKMK